MHIGPFEIRAPFCQAGLAGYSDRAMRLVARRRGCSYAVTEALLDITMLNGGRGLEKSIDITDEDHPIAGQIIGSEADQLARAAVILHEAGYDVIDLNFACPVKKIKNKARGGHMLYDLPRALTILKTVRDALPPHVPTSISLRRGFDDSAESTDRFWQIAEAAWAHGYSAIRVHGRTVEQKYLGPADWSFIREVKQRYPEKTILGSGDVFTAEDAVRMLRETGVDMAWIARGAIGNPWIFRQAEYLLNAGHPDVVEAGHAPPCLGVPEPLQLEERATHASPLQDGERARRASPLQPPTIAEQREALREHFSLAMELHGEQLAGRRMRKLGIKYARFHPQAMQVKQEFIAVSSLRGWLAVLEKWYAHDGAGVWPDPKAADEVNEGGETSCEAA